MTKRVQFIRHAVAAADLFLGRVGEITVNLTQNTVRVHDGATLGGHEMAKKDLSNSPAGTNSTDGKITAAQVGNLESAFAHLSAGGAAHALVTTSVNGFMSAADKTKLDGIEAGAAADLSAGEILALLSGVDGSGSGLDADLLDGLNAVSGAATANTIAARDANGRIKAADPSANSDVATKAYADSLQAFGNPTRMVFYNAAAPAGWTAVTGINDRVIRVNNPSAGTSDANSWAISGLSHSHTHTIAHTHSLAGHGHTLGTTSTVLIDSAVQYYVHISGGVLRASPPGVSLAINRVVDDTGGPTVGSTGGASSGSSGGASTNTVSSSGAWRPPVVNVLVAEKD